MTLIRHLKLQPIEQKLSSNASATDDAINLNESIDASQLESFLNSAIDDMQNDSLWQSMHSED